MTTFLRLVGFLKPHLPRVMLAVLLGVATVASNVGLLAIEAYVISAAALVSFLGALVIPIYLLRLFGVFRAGARYAERLVSHDLTFKLLADFRTWFYTHLEPLAPARLLRYRTGDLLSRIVQDVEELQNVYLRIVVPVAVTSVTSLLTFVLLYSFGPSLAFVALGYLLAAGIGVPLLVGSLARGLGQRQLEMRGELNARIVDGVQGAQDLLAFGGEEEQERAIATLNRRLGRVQGRMDDTLCANLLLARPRATDDESAKGTGARPALRSRGTPARWSGEPAPSSQGASGSASPSRERS